MRTLGAVFFSFIFLTSAAASDADKPQWTCRKLLLVQGAIAAILAVSIPPLRYSHTNVREGGEVQRFYQRARRAATEPLQEEDFTTLGRTYAYFHASSEWGAMWPYVRQQPLYRLDFMQRTYALLSRADREQGGLIERKMGELGIPGVLNDPKGDGFDAFHSYFGGGWSLESPMDTYYLQNESARARLAELTGFALKKDWERYTTEVSATQTSISLQEFLSRETQEQ